MRTAQMGRSTYETILFTIILGTTMMGMVRDSFGFEMVLDVDKDVAPFKFHGHYFYTRKGWDLEVLAPTINSQLAQSSSRALAEHQLTGIWFTKHFTGRENKFSVFFRLNHVFAAQAWAVFLAHPSVKVTITVNKSKTLGTFWSDGKNWCDAVVDVRLHNEVTLEASTPLENDFFLLDKFVIGVFDNITDLESRTLNECLREPLLVPPPSPPSSSPTTLTILEEEGPGLGNHLELQNFIEKEKAAGPGSGAKIRKVNLVENEHFSSSISSSASIAEVGGGGHGSFSSIGSSTIMGDEPNPRTPINPIQEPHLTSNIKSTQQQQQPDLLLSPSASSSKDKPKPTKILSELRDRNGTFLQNLDMALELPLHDQGQMNNSNLKDDMKCHCTCYRQNV